MYASKLSADSNDLERRANLSCFAFCSLTENFFLLYPYQSLDLNQYKNLIHVHFLKKEKKEKIGVYPMISMSP